MKRMISKASDNRRCCSADDDDDEEGEGEGEVGASSKLSKRTRWTDMDTGSGIADERRSCKAVNNFTASRCSLAVSKFFSNTHSRQCAHEVTLCTNRLFASFSAARRARNTDAFRACRFSRRAARSAAVGARRLSKCEGEGSSGDGSGSVVDLTRF